MQLPKIDKRVIGAFILGTMLAISSQTFAVNLDGLVADLGLHVNPHIGETIADIAGKLLILGGLIYWKVKNPTGAPATTIDANAKVVATGTVSGSLESPGIPIAELHDIPAELTSPLKGQP
jgi:hypothetical protein